MRLSTKAQYAVRALVSLNLYADGSPVTIRDIAAREDISLTYLEQLLSKLRRGGIVESVRGPGGGYVLARAAKDIRIDEVIDSVEEPLNPVPCLDNHGECNCGDVCVTSSVWRGLGERIRQFLASITIEDLTREARQRRRDAAISNG